MDTILNSEILLSVLIISAVAYTVWDASKALARFMLSGRKIKKQNG